MDLNITWFLLVGILIIGYAVLDGFDLGIGILHLFTKDENEKRTEMNSIGPVWDGNEVWLLTGGGALFAAFPVVYATVFSGFYIAFMLLLFAPNHAGLLDDAPEPDTSPDVNWPKIQRMHWILLALALVIIAGGLATNYRG